MIPSAGVSDRAAGLLLFLPVPIVLGLFTRQPLGPAASLVVGLVVMATHRLYARPFALSRAKRRCLWCGGEAGDGPALEVEEPAGNTSWRACSSAHVDSVVRTLGWASRRSRPLAAGILGSLAALFGLSLAAGLGMPAGLRAEDAVEVFRAGVALTVLPLGWLSTSRGSPSAGRLPFPLHVQALLGTAWVLWLFRLVGLWWLAAAVLHAARRLP
jgi:hypothetical protein